MPTVEAAEQAKAAAELTAQRMVNNLKAMENEAERKFAQMQADKEALRRRDEEQQKERQKQVSDQENRHQAIARQLDALLSSVRAENSDRVTAVSEVGSRRREMRKLLLEWEDLATACHTLE